MCGMHDWMKVFQTLLGLMMTATARAGILDQGIGGTPVDRKERFDRALGHADAMMDEYFAAVEWGR